MTPSTEIEIIFPIGDDVDDWDLEDEEDDEDDVINIPFQPDIDAGPQLEAGLRPVDYSARGISDVVLSGPVRGGYGPGRWMSNRAGAYTWCVGKYGAGRVSQVPYVEGRWAFLIKGLRA